MKMRLAACNFLLLFFIIYSDGTSDEFQTDLRSFFDYLSRLSEDSEKFNRFNNVVDSEELETRYKNRFDYDCYSKNMAPGVCKQLRDCPTLQERVKHVNPIYIYQKLRDYSCASQSPLSFCCPADLRSAKETKFSDSLPVRKPSLPIKPPQVTPWENNVNVIDLENHINRKLLPRDCGQDYNKDQIIGGNETHIGEYPWMVAIQFRLSNGSVLFPACGGSLINQKYILTAAHCMAVEDRSRALRVPLNEVHLGDHNIKTRQEPDCEMRGRTRVCNDPIVAQVEEILMHPGYKMSRKPRPHDIALLRLKTPIQLSGSVKPICLPFDDENSNKNHTGEIAWVAGWGVTSRTDNTLFSPVLLKAPVPIVTCRDSVKGFVICAGRGDTDTCQGDSGGPLMTFDTIEHVGQWHLRGVVSYGGRCGTSAAVYTRVSRYLKWILDSIRE